VLSDSEIDELELNDRLVLSDSEIDELELNELL